MYTLSPSTKYYQHLYSCTADCCLCAIGKRWWRQGMCTVEPERRGLTSEQTNKQALQSLANPSTIEVNNYKGFCHLFLQYFTVSTSVGTHLYSSTKLSSALTADIDHNCPSNSVQRAGVQQRKAFPSIMFVVHPTWMKKRGERKKRFWARQSLLSHSWLQKEKVPVIGVC